MTEKEKQILEILSSIAWVKEDIEEELDFTAYYFYLALKDIAELFKKEGAC